MPTLVLALRVVPLVPPRPWRHCPRCDIVRPFASADVFRVNAQKRRLDVWLVRRCADCGFPFHQPVEEHVTPESLGPRLAEYLASDPARAAEVAWDAVAAGRHGRLEPAEVGVEVEPAEPPYLLRIELVRPVRVRLRDVLRLALGKSRSALDRAVGDGEIVLPAGRTLASAAADGALVEVLPRRAAPAVRAG